jgi:nucleoside-diphosphate-sugar epimerase
MKKILLIGGSGYIGSRLYDHLSQFYIIHNIDLGWFGHSSRFLVNEMDYNNLTKEELSKYTHVILLAGHSSVSMCQGRLNDCFRNNVVNFNNLVDKLSPYGDQMFIYASTAAVYGANPNYVTEDEPIVAPINEYDFTKICNEYTMKLNKTSIAKNSVGLRLGTVSGFSKNMRTENLLNALSLSAIDKMEIIVSNPFAMRSVLGLNDLCRAIETIIRTNVIHNPVYNLTSVNDSIGNFGNKIQKLSGAELIINDSLKTGYSFNVSNELFSKHYGFEFRDTIESIYEEFVQNYENIIYKFPRSPKKYD